MTKTVSFLSALVAGLTPTLVSAHENYVLSQEDIARGMNDWSVNVWSALSNPNNLRIGATVAAATLATFAVYYFFMMSRPGMALDRMVKRLEPVGHVILRLALGASFLASAYFNSFLGPEIPLTSLPGGEFLKPVLLAVGFCFLFGFASELAGLAALVVILLATFVYGGYMLTYFNYYGEFIALILFGSRILSMDKLVLGARILGKKISGWEIPLIRITYGLSVLYPAVTIKLLHPSIIVEIAAKYNMMQFWWLFPSDPLLISLGTGLAQIAVGLFIIVGFETRLNSFVTLVLYIMSIAFFKEAVWPHYILLALALYLTVNDGGGWSVDRWLQKRKIGRTAAQATG